jgi:hypothetical protein
MKSPTECDQIENILGEGHLLNEIERMKLHPESQICHGKRRKFRLMQTGKVLESACGSDTT